MVFVVRAARSAFLTGPEWAILLATGLGTRLEALSMASIATQVGQEPLAITPHHCWEMARATAFALLIDSVVHSRITVR